MNATESFISKRLRAWAALLVLLVASSLQTRAAEPPNAAPILLVANQGDGTLSVVDARAQAQVAAIAEGVPTMLGHEVATSPDGKLAYMPLYGDSGVGKPGSDGREILVIDIATRKIVSRFDFGHGVRPHCVVYSHGLLYVTAELDKSIAVIDPKSMKLLAEIPTNQELSHMLAVSHDGKLGYTANVGSGTVSVLDLAARKFITAIPVAPVVQRISVSNDASMVFTSDQTQPRLAVIDAATRKVRNWVELPALGYGSASTKDGDRLLVTLPSLGALAVVDLKTMKTVQTIPVGEHPQAVLARPDGQFAYVSCLGGHQVAVVDLSDWKVVKLIDVGPKADGMAWAGAASSR